LKRKVVCFCEHEFETEISESVELTVPVEDSILAGDFQSLRCPGCGKALKPEFPARLSRGGGVLFFVPELDRVSFYRGALAYPVGDADRVAIGYEELAEKILLRRAGLDDRVAEVLKYYLLQKVPESSLGEGDVRLLFSRVEGESLVFHAHGLRAGEVGVLKVGRAMADKVSAQLHEKLAAEPFSQILAGPYVSVNKLATENPE
jgi:hypothetical protein